MTITDRRSPSRTASTGYPTVDGLCWIEHADPGRPVMEEFVLPTRVYDTALGTGVSDQDFDIEGSVGIEPPEGPRSIPQVGWIRTWGPSVYRVFAVVLLIHFVILRRRRRRMSQMSRWRGI